MPVQCECRLPDLQERLRDPLPLQHGVLPDGRLLDLRHVEERGPQDESGPPPRVSEAHLPSCLPRGGHIWAGVGGPGARSWGGRLHSLPGLGGAAAAPPHRLPHILRVPPGRDARHVSVFPGRDAGLQAGEEGQRGGAQPHPQPGCSAPGGSFSGSARPVLLLPGGGAGCGDPQAPGGPGPVLLTPQPAGAHPPEHLHHRRPAQAPQPLRQEEGEAAEQHLQGTCKGCF